jgi:hypothetical protein
MAQVYTEWKCDISRDGNLCHKPFLQTKYLTACEQINETKYVPIAIAIFGVRTEHEILELNLSCHSDLYEPATSSLIRGIQMGQMSKLRWLIGFFTNAIWAESLYFLSLLLLSFCKILP